MERCEAAENSESDLISFRLAGRGKANLSTRQWAPRLYNLLVPVPALRGILF